MRNSLVRSAVALAIAGAAPLAANAAAYTIHISGASAQRNFWEGDLEGIAGGTFNSNVDASGTTVCTFIKTSPSLNPQVPDLHSQTCTISAHRTAGSTIIVPPGVNTGDTITLNYEAELGSVWGIASALNTGGPGGRCASNGITYAANTGTCAANIGRRSVTAATVTGYSRDLDTATAGLSAPTAVDIDVSDMEPIFWADPDNWSYADGAVNAPDGTGTNHVLNILAVPGQGQPTLAQLQGLEQNWQEINGEVFTVIAENTTTPTSGLTGLSTQSLRAIFNGQYKTWSQVPEAAGLANNSASIVVCRRDHGSGSQVAASYYFEQKECGGNNGYDSTGSYVGTPLRFVSTPQSASGSNLGHLDQTIPAFQGLSFKNNPIENFSSNDVKNCVSGYAGQAIGILVLSSIGNHYGILNIDGVQPNAHNAAIGAYKFAVNTWAFNNISSTQTGTAVTIGNQLFNDAITISNGVLPPESGSATNGVWTVTPNAGSAVTVYGLADNNSTAFTFDSTHPPVSSASTGPNHDQCGIPNAAATL